MHERKGLLAINSLLLLLVLMTACGSGEIKPIDIEDSDMCTFCKMAISQKQFAAEIITDDQKVLKFDDIGCLLRFRKGAGSDIKPAGIFVTDYNSRNWVKAQDVFFVHSKSVKTPMNGGILGFADKSAADREANESQTKVLSFDDLSAP